MTTEALVFLGDLDPQAVGPGIEFATHYEPTPVQDFRALMELVPEGFAFSETTFVDIGSGMGRAVMLASGYPFARIIGVEISPALHEIARENLRRYREAPLQCRDIRLVCCDAGGYELPRGNLLLYLYNPFDQTMVERFLERLCRSGPREVMLLYHTPVQRAVIEQRTIFEAIGDVGFAAAYRATLS